MPYELRKLKWKKMPHGNGCEANTIFGVVSIIKESDTCCLITWPKNVSVSGGPYQSFKKAKEVAESWNRARISPALHWFPAKTKKEKDAEQAAAGLNEAALVDSDQSTEPQPQE